MEYKEKDLRNLLFSIIDKDEFPDKSFEIRHIERIEHFEQTPKNNFRFKIERHPHLFGQSSIGRPSFAYVPITDHFELDPVKQKVSLRDSQKGEPVIDYEFLAQEEVEFYFANSDFEDEISSIQVEKGVVDFAMREFETIPWLQSYQSEEDVPPDFTEKFFTELRRHFIREMLKIYNKHKP